MACELSATAADLSAWGITADVAAYYAQTGWLKRLGSGVYCHPVEPPALYPSLRLLQGRVRGLHVGGKTALAWHGDTQYLYTRPTIHLYGWDSGYLPGWFADQFRASYSRKRLFDESPDALLHVRPFEGREDAPLVSSRERALLEMLSGVKPGQTMDEARELAEFSYDMRPDVLRVLLEKCANGKAARLCRQLGRELNLPWAAETGPVREISLPAGHWKMQNLNRFSPDRRSGRPDFAG